MKRSKRKPKSERASAGVVDMNVHRREEAKLAEQARDVSYENTRVACECGCGECEFAVLRKEIFVDESERVYVDGATQKSYDESRS